MNKRLRIFTATILLCCTHSLKAQDFTELPKTVTISIEQFKSFGYSGATPDKTKQPISTKEDALNFIQFIYDLNPVELRPIRGQMNIFLAQTNQKQHDKYAVIVIKHPMDLEKLYAEDATKQAALAPKYIAALGKKKKLNELVDVIDARGAAIEESAKAIPPGGGEKVFKQDLLTSAMVKELNELKTLRENTVIQIAPLDKEMADLQASFLKVSSEIKEDAKIESLVLDHYKKEWTDYLLDVDEILYVLIGGPEDIQKGKLKIDNKPTSFETDLHDLMDVATSLPVGETIRDNIKLNDKIPITFLLVKSNKIKPPSGMTYTMPDTTKKVVYDIHEKARFGISLGFSGAFVDRKNFSLDAQNELTIVTDDAKKTELKSNLIALFEFSPWGRDIDRLESILGKNKDIKSFDLNRLSLVAGVKLSKDPLQSIYGGLSYAFSKTAALNVGISFNRTPKDVTKLPVGVNATLDYLKENADQELIPKFFFGLSFSPKFLGKSLGIVK